MGFKTIQENYRPEAPLNEVNTTQVNANKRTKKEIIKMIEPLIQEYITLCVEEWSEKKEIEIENDLIESFQDEIGSKNPDREVKYIEDNFQERAEDMFQDEFGLAGLTDIQQLNKLFKTFKQ